MGASPFGPAIGPPIVLPDAQQPAAAFTIDDDDDLTARGFGRFVPFDGGALRLAGPWHTNRHLSLLTHGGWIDTNGFDAIVEGDVINDGSLTKTGEGSLTLCGAIEHRKDTFVLEGTLIVESRHDAPVFVDGGVLGGTGRVGTVSVTNGAISPGGRRPGVLTADEVTLSPRASLIIDINGPVCGTDYARLDVKAAATINDATLIARFGARAHARHGDHHPDQRARHVRRPSRRRDRHGRHGPAGANHLHGRQRPRRRVDRAMTTNATAAAKRGRGT